MHQFEFYHNDLNVKQFIILFNCIVQIEKKTYYARDSL